MWVRDLRSMPQRQKPDRPGEGEVRKHRCCFCVPVGLQCRARADRLGLLQSTDARPVVGVMGADVREYKGES